jgi:hypothetical protein
MGEVVAWLAPLAGMTMTAVIVWCVVWYLVKRAEYTAKPDRDFRLLAEEAVRSQKSVVEETRRLAEAVKEIQQLLAKV